MRGSKMTVRILRDDPHVDWELGNQVQFRLTYQGLLLSESNKGSIANARATHKHEIHKAIHPQLRRLWSQNPFLTRHHNRPPGPGVEFAMLKPENTIEGLAERFSRNGYNFVPLLHRGLNAMCSVEVLYLRSDPPGSVFRSGDIDNRLKTLFDGLTMPRDAYSLATTRIRRTTSGRFSVCLKMTRS